MQRILLSLDSRDAVLGSPPEAARFQFGRTYSKVQAITLKAFEWPLLQPNIRAPSLSTLRLNVQGDIQDFVLDNANITRITDLLAALTTATDSLGLTWGVGSTGYVYFQGGFDLPSTTVEDTPLGRMILGFGTYPSVAGVLIASKPYCLNADHVWFLSIDRLPVRDVLNVNGRAGQFRLQGAGVFGTVLLLNEGVSSTQRVEVSAGDFTLADLTVQLYDRFGNKCTGCADWTALFELEVGV